MPTRREHKTISVVIPVFNADLQSFTKTLLSLCAQTSDDFEVCISDGGPQKSKALIDQFKDKLDIKYCSSGKTLGIADNTNHAIKLATGDYLAFLDHDDILSENAIAELTNTINSTNCDVMYSDEDVIDESGRVLRHYFKPDFSLDLLYSQNYICHLFCVKRSLACTVGAFDHAFDGCQDYDYILRVVEHTNKIVHIPKVLYSRVAVSGSTAADVDAKPYADDAGLRALNKHLSRCYGKIASAKASDKPFTYQTTFNTFKKQKVEIIIAMRDGLAMSKQCVESIAKHSKAYKYSITIIDNQSVEVESKKWLRQIAKQPCIKVIKADFDFNWSKLQNLGIKNSDADVFVFLNNDTIVTDDSWLQVLCSNALRKDIGVVGPLLYYEDGTIQHAGVVIGLSGYADHIYKGTSLAQPNSERCFVSPSVNRNVTAVTGACMAISRKTLDKIGIFDENFIICGSDVEICLRAYNAGLRNLYTPYTSLVHLESKTRDTFIPDIDFKLSQQAYQKFWDNGDPFFNPNLSYKSTTPLPAIDDNITELAPRQPLFRRVLGIPRRVLKRSKLLVKLYRKLFKIDERENISFGMHVMAIDPQPCGQTADKPRINLIIPTINARYIYGGIATALKFFDAFDAAIYNKRIIVHDVAATQKDMTAFPDFELVDDLESDAPLQVVNTCVMPGHTLAVAKNDIFIASAWWTAQNIYPVIRWQKEHYQLRDCHNLIYFIQDFEPGFYPWSSDYICAEATYRSEIPTTAIFNSNELEVYFQQHGYHFDSTYHFGPILNDRLKEHLLNDEEKPRKKQIIIYGRPSVPRNAFDIIIYALRCVFSTRTDAHEWSILSLGETHPKVSIKENLSVVPAGKLSLSEYANVMEESYLGVSLMISPHPSYPPLEMAAFGVKTITNTFDNKDLSYFNQNIISIKDCDYHKITEAISRELNAYQPNIAQKVFNDSYINASDQFKEIASDITNQLSK